MPTREFICGRDASFVSRLLFDTLEATFHSAGVTWVPAPWRERWSNRPTTYVGHIEHAANTVWFDDRDAMRLDAGQAVILPPNIRLSHEVAANSSGKSRVRWSHFQFLAVHSVDIATHLELPQVFTGRMAERLGDFNEALVEANQPSSATNPLAAVVRTKRLAFDMLEMILACVPLKEGAVEKFERLRRFEPVLEHLKKCYARPLTVDALAKKAGMSSSRFQAAFKAVMGVAPMEYVIRLRIEAAQRLLGFSGHSVGEVAAQCGYDDQLYFSKVFKARTGSTPSQYRGNVQATMSGS